MTSPQPAPPATPVGATGIHPLLAERWSTRAFDASARLDAAVVDRLLEAARWSPSASNSQPWRFALATRGTPAFDALAATLAPGNATWASQASALLVVASERTAPDGAPRPWADLDAGQALGHLTVQAAHERVAMHTMGGFDATAVSALYHLPSGVVPLVVVALGVLGDVDALPDALRDRERAPRQRRALDELVLQPVGQPVEQPVG